MMICHRHKAHGFTLIEPFGKLRASCLPCGKVGPAHRRGFTLIEILVSVVIMSLMITMVSMVLNQSQKVVNVAEARIRSNGAAANIAEMIRQDLRSASKNGVLCITDTSSTDTTPRMLLTTAGVAYSVTHTTRGMGSFVAYGRVPNKADPGNSNNHILWRPGWVLTANPDPGWQNWMDIWQLDFSTLQGYTRLQVDDIISHNSFTGQVNNLRVPPDNMTDINRLWQVATTGCSSLSIMWTDGSATDGNMNWYGRDISGNLHPKDNNWESRDKSSLNDPANFYTPEYDGKQGSSVYRVLWTHHNQSAWPKAIKIRFALRDTAMPAEFQDVDYEVIATLGQ